MKTRHDKLNSLRKCKHPFVDGYLYYDIALSIQSPSRWWNLFCANESYTATLRIRDARRNTLIVDYKMQGANLDADESEKIVAAIREQFSNANLLGHKAVKLCLRIHDSQLDLAIHDQKSHIPVAAAIRMINKRLTHFLHRKQAAPEVVATHSPV